MKAEQSGKQANQTIEALGLFVFFSSVKTYLYIMQNTTQTMLIYIWMWKCDCRCSYAGWRGHWHGGGPVAKSEPSAHWHLQCQLGPWGWWQNRRWACKIGQRSFPARSYRGVHVRACLCVWKTLSCLRCFLSVVSNWTVHAWEDTDGRRKEFLTLTIRNGSPSLLKSRKKPNRNMETVLSPYFT